MQRSILITTGAAVAALALAGTAQAAPAGRLSGSYDATLTTISSTGSASIGATYYATYRFQPTCASGVCTTRISYVLDLTNTTVRFPLTPTGSAYVGTGHYVSPCFDDHGTVIEDRGYDTTERMTLNVAKVSGGTATRFTGSDEITQVLTSAGRQAGCKALGRTVYSLSGTRHA